jgi:hypothetical protein
MQIYVDNSLAYSATGRAVTHTFSLSSGQHYIVAKGWDGSGSSWYTGEHITVK